MSSDVREVPCPDGCEFRGQQHVHLESASTGQGQVWGLDDGIPALLDPFDLQRDAPVRSPLHGAYLHAIEQRTAELKRPLYLNRHEPNWELRRALWGARYEAPVLPGACYKASFGWVHVKPGCRCERMTR